MRYDARGTSAWPRALRQSGQTAPDGVSDQYCTVLVSVERRSARRHEGATNVLLSCTTGQSIDDPLIRSTAGPPVPGTLLP